MGDERAPDRLRIRALTDDPESPHWRATPAQVDCDCPWRQYQAMATDPGGAATVSDWRAAGEAWGRSANDWSCLYEHYSIDVLIALLARLSVGPTTSLLDIACGSGLAVRIADAMGATVAGIDAASELVAVARERTPTADVRIGSMYELPWPDGSFDVALSVNGIWGGCDAALAEAFRVLRPGGLIGISFWGTGPPLDARTFFRIFADHAPDEHLGSMRHLNNISFPGVAEEMLTASGFAVVERGSRTSVIEWPDGARSRGGRSRASARGPRTANQRPVRAQTRGARRARAISRPAASTA